MSKGIVYSWIAYFAFLVFTVINTIIFNLLHLEPRMWVTALTWLLIVLPPVFLIFFMILKVARICKKRTAKGLLILVLIIYSVISMGVLFVLGLRGLFHLEDEKILEDGSILVTEAAFPEPGPSYRCLPVMFFARQPIPGTKKYPVSESPESPDSSSHDSSSPDSVVKSNDSPAKNSPNDYTPSDTLSDSQENNELTKAAQIIYNQIFASQGKKCSFQYNAKGNLYVILDKGTRELDGTTVNTQETLTYDRVSKNGKCHLFVYYEEHYDTDGNKLDNTSILNFYAVNPETEEVTAADKTSWSDTGSAAYHEATGEY